MDMWMQVRRFGFLLVLVISKRIIWPISEPESWSRQVHVNLDLKKTDRLSVFERFPSLQKSRR